MAPLFVWASFGRTSTASLFVWTGFGRTSTAPLFFGARFGKILKAHFFTRVFSSKRLFSWRSLNKEEVKSATTAFFK